MLEGHEMERSRTTGSIRGGRLRRQRKGGIRGDRAASKPSESTGAARGPTTGCTAGARRHRGHSAGVGGGMGSGRQAHRGRRPRRGPAGTRSHSRTLPCRTPPLPRPLRSSWAGRLRRSPRTTGPPGTGALRAQEWTVRPRGCPHPPPHPTSLPLKRPEIRQRAQPTPECSQ